MALSKVQAGFDVAEKTIDLVVKIGEVADFGALAPLLEALPIAGAAFAVIGSVMSLVKAFLPDPEFEAIMKQFAKVNEGIHQVRDDIKQLEKTMTWETTKLQYSTVVSRIETGMLYATMIGKNKNNEAEKRRYQDRLKEFCADDDMILAVNTLFEGVIGGGFFTNNILEHYYTYSGGNRPEMSKLGCRLIQLLCGGMMVIMTYETLKRGEAGAQDMVELYKGKLGAVHDKVKAALNRCVTEVTTNMEHDLTNVIANNAGRHNKDIVTTLYNKMSVKYDWLHVVCCIYNNLNGFDHHIMAGYRVEKLHFHDKCGIVYYRDRSRHFVGASRKTEATQVVDGAKGITNAQAAYSHIHAELDRRHIGWWGITCIRRSVDLWEENNVSNSVIWELGPHFTLCVLLD